MAAPGAAGPACLPGTEWRNRARHRVRRWLDQGPTPASFLAGTRISRRRGSTALRRDLGRCAARLARGLRLFQASGANHKPLWDLPHAAEFGAGRCGPRRAGAVWSNLFSIRLRGACASPAPAPGAQPVHNDLNPHNVVVDPDERTASRASSISATWSTRARQQSRHRGRLPGRPTGRSACDRQRDDRRLSRGHSADPSNSTSVRLDLHAHGPDGRHHRLAGRTLPENATYILRNNQPPGPAEPDRGLSARRRKITCVRPAKRSDQNDDDQRLRPDEATRVRRRR